MQLDALGESRPPPRQLIAIILLHDMNCTSDLQDMQEPGRWEDLMKNSQAVYKFARQFSPNIHTFFCEYVFMLNYRSILEKKT